MFSFTVLPSTWSSGNNAYCIKLSNLIGAFALILLFQQKVTGSSSALSTIIQGMQTTEVRLLKTEFNKQHVTLQLSNSTNVRNCLWHSKFYHGIIYVFPLGVWSGCPLYFKLETVKSPKIYG